MISRESVFSNHIDERPHALHGVYQPVVHGPDLGLSSVNRSDGTYSRTRIYPVFGIHGDDERVDPNKAIGDFFVQFAGHLCARRRHLSRMRRRSEGGKDALQDST